MRGEAAQWPDDPRDATVDRATQEEAVRLAEAVMEVVVGAAGPSGSAGAGG